MKTLELEIKGLPHCPRNRSHTIVMKGRVPMMIKTQIARAYEEAIQLELFPREEEVKTFREAFNPNINYLVAEWILASPDVFTKEGRVSRNSTDLDAHKVLQDTVMKFIGIDDAYILVDKREKIQGEYSVKVSLTIEKL